MRNGAEGHDKLTLDQIAKGTINTYTIYMYLSFLPFCSKTNPVLIASPPELAGQTLENRLMTYDWENQFDKFQQATQRGSFVPMCRRANNVPLPVSRLTNTKL
jgi:hypothetical protein